MTQSVPSNTIAILSRSDPERLLALISTLRHQSLVPDEILVVWNGPEALPAAVGDTPGVRVITIRPSEFGHGRTRNLVLRESRTEVMVLLSDDALPANDQWLEALLVPFGQGPTVAAVFSRQVARSTGSTDGMFRSVRYPADSFEIALAPGRVLDLKRMPVSNASAAYRVVALRDVGGFAEDVVSGEDLAATITLLDAGFKVWYAASSAVVHSHDYNFVEQVRRTFDMAMSQRQISRRCRVNLPRSWGGYGSLALPLIRTVGTESPRAALQVGIYLTARVAGVLLAKASDVLPHGLIVWMSAQRWFYAALTEAGTQRE